MLLAHAHPRFATCADWYFHLGQGDGRRSALQDGAQSCPGTCALHAPSHQHPASAPYGHQVLCLSREDLSSGAAALRHAQDLLHLIDPPQSLLAPLVGASCVAPWSMLLRPLYGTTRFTCCCPPLCQAGMTRGGVIQLGQQVGPARGRVPRLLCCPLAVRCRGSVPCAQHGCLCALTRHCLACRACSPQAGAPWHLTYSCTEGSKGGGSQLPPGVPGVHCGKCEHCQDRQAAFAAARVQDTAVYAG